MTYLPMGQSRCHYVLGNQMVTNWYNTQHHKYYWDYQMSNIVLQIRMIMLVSYLREDVGHSQQIFTSFIVYKKYFVAKILLESLFRIVLGCQLQLLLMRTLSPRLSILTQYVDDQEVREDKRCIPSKRPGLGDFVRPYLFSRIRYFSTPVDEGLGEAQALSRIISLLLLRGALVQILGLFSSALTDGVLFEDQSSKEARCNLQLWLLQLRFPQCYYLVIRYLPNQLYMLNSRIYWVNSYHGL